MICSSGFEWLHHGVDRTQRDLARVLTLGAVVSCTAASVFELMIE